MSSNRQSGNHTVRWSTTICYYPIILPRGHSVTNLIVKHYHELANHSAGTNLGDSGSFNMQEDKSLGERVY